MKLLPHRRVIACAFVLANWISATTSAEAPKGEEVFKGHCAECHEPATDRAPPKELLKLRRPDEVVNALTTGIMKVNGVDKGLSTEEIDAVALYLTGKVPPRLGPQQVDSPKCEASKHAFSMKGPSWNGWSPDAQNLRYQAKPGLSVKDIPNLQVKWSFNYIGGRYGQPTIVGGRVFAASSSGVVYALDAKSGCTHWRFNAPAGVRTTINVGENKAAPSGYAAYFGTFDRIYYAVDAGTGAKIWESTVETYKRNVLTGAPVLYKNLLIAPVSAWEEVGTAVGSYECCRARGSVVAMDIKTGAIVWKTYTLPESQPTKKNSVGTQMYGPAGAVIWSAPTIDAKRKLVYVTTGDAYVEVPEQGSDSVFALDVNTGAVRWKRQLAEGDAYLAGCPKVKTVKSPPNCPEKNGPDSDFGSSAFLIKGPNGKDVLIAGQKSALVHAINPDNGAVVWSVSIGKGSALGGVQWGMASDGKQIFAANADISGGKPGIHALDPKTGKTNWYTASPKVKCAWQVGGDSSGTVCINGNSQAPTAIPGAVIAGTIDGHLRGYDSKTGAIIWDVDTAAARYDTLNGTKQQPGGSMDAGGATVVDGMVYVMSGYAGVLGGTPENVLVAYSVGGK